MDYRALLAKYMQVVIDHESVTFLEYLCFNSEEHLYTHHSSDLGLTPIEYNELVRIEKEIRQ